MKKFVSFVALGVTTVMLVAGCSSNADSSAVQSDGIVPHTGATYRGDLSFACLYQASVAADRSVLQGGSMFVVIRDQDDWSELWEHILERERRYPGGGCPAEGEPPLLNVDFDERMAILLVHPAPSSGYAIYVDQIVATNEGWTVQATRIVPAGGFTEIAYPHQIIATEQFDGELTLVVTEK